MTRDAEAVITASILKMYLSASKPVKEKIKKKIGVSEAGKSREKVKAVIFNLDGRADEEKIQRQRKAIHIIVSMMSVEEVVSVRGGKTSLLKTFSIVLIGLILAAIGLVLVSIPALVKVFMLNKDLIDAYNYFDKKNDRTKTSFCYALPQDKILNKGESYYMAIYQISICRKILGVDKHTDTLLPLLYSINSQSVIHNEDVINHIFSRSQTEGREHNANSKDLDPEMIHEMRYDFAETLHEEKSKRISELKLQIESDRQRHEQQMKEYYASVVKNQYRFIRNWQNEIEMLYNSDEKRVRQLQSVIKLAENRIEQYRKEEQERLERINEAAQIEVSDKIISLNLINVI